MAGRCLDDVADLADDDLAWLGLDSGLDGWLAVGGLNEFLGDGSRACLFESFAGSDDLAKSELDSGVGSRCFELSCLFSFHLDCKGFRRLM